MGADWSCSWPGVLEAVSALSWHGREQFASAESKNFTVDGKLHGTFKSVDNFSWLKINDAGHYVSYYRKWNHSSY